MKQKEELEELKRMLDTAENAVDGNVPTSGELPELHSEPAFEIDYSKIQKKCNKQAKTLLKNATGLVLGDELVKTNPYIQSKLKTDILSLGGMLYQVELLTTMQQALTEEMRHGAMAARMFEVFTGLSKTISENNKQLLQTVEAIKITYLDLKDNIMQLSETPTGISPGVSRTDQGIIALGSRDLITQANDRKKERLKAAHGNNIEIQDIQDIDSEEIK